MSINDDVQRSMWAQAWDWMVEGWIETGRCFVLPYVPELHDRYIRHDAGECAGDDVPGPGRGDPQVPPQA